MLDEKSILGRFLSDLLYSLLWMTWATEREDVSSARELFIKRMGCNSKKLKKSTLEIQYGL
jgi:hypothetical protein